MEPQTSDQEARKLLARTAALEELLGVHERTVLEQSARIQTAMEERSAHITKLQAQNDVMMGRELRILELKKEINDLLAEMGKPHRY